MKTRHFSVSEIADAAKLLHAGDLVAFPTETVYGLGANALNEEAVQKIFEAKGRPSDNPLIVHIESCTQLAQLVLEIPEVASRLMERFWPGPLTIVLPKRPEVSNLVTAGLDTVAVRMPNHTVALELIRQSGVPLAAPSANRSGRPSATTWQAVSEDLDGRIAGIICAEPTVFGLESTVVDVNSDRPRILRPGGVSLEQLRDACDLILPYECKPIEGNQTHLNSPGLRHKHYQPRAKVLIVSDSTDLSKLGLNQSYSRPIHYIGLHSPSDPSLFSVVKICRDPHDYGATLFDFFRQADLCNAGIVCCEATEECGIGAALMDRLRRASH